MLDFIKNWLRKIPKVGGHKLDPEDKEYPEFNKAMFGASGVVYTGDVDLRPFSSARQNQMTTSTCVAQSMIKALEIKRIQKYGSAAHVDLSICDLYYGCRERHSPKETNLDQGTYIYLAAEVLQEVGVCRESEHPFKKENLFKPPSILVTREDRLNRINGRFKIKTKGNDRVDDCIANLRMGNPIVFGTAVGDNWLNYTNRSHPLTPTVESKGRHAICLVGWVDGNFIIENSWGEWGYQGFGFLRPEVIADSQAQDFWCITDGSELYLESM